MDVHEGMLEWLGRNLTSKISTATVDAGAVEQEYIANSCQSHVPSWINFSFCCYPSGFSIMAQALATTTTTIPHTPKIPREKGLSSKIRGKTLLFEVQ